MALWAGLTLNTNELANVVNKLYSKKAIPMAIQATPLLDAFFGRRDNVNNSRAMRVGKTKSITGKDYEFKLLGSLPSPATVADGSAELAAATIGYDADIHAAATVAISHWAYTHGVPASEYDRFKGSEAKTLDWIDEVWDYIRGGYDNVLATALHATDAPDRTHFGGWQVPVDSSTSYAGVTRSDAGNANFRAVERSAGLVTVKKIQTDKNTVRTRKGMLTVGVAGVTLFTHLQQIAQGYSQAVASSDTSRWGADGVNISGIDFLLDPYTTDGVIGMFDPKWWELITSQSEVFTERGLIYNYLAVDGWVMPTKSWLQNVCVMPKCQVKWTDATDV